MSLFLQIVVGDGVYLLDAKPILEVRSEVGGAEAMHDLAVPTVDLRQLFAEPADTRGCAILLVQTSGSPAALVVDRVDGLAEFAEADFRPLPPIGPLGALIDAVAVRSADARPLLRLRGERALAAVAVG